MNDFLDKLGNAAKRAAGGVATEVSIAAEKQRLSDCYKDLGKLCYQAIKRGEMPDFPAEIAKIDESLRYIESLKGRRNVTDVEVEPKTAEAEPEVVKPDITAEEQDFILVEEI